MENIIYADEHVEARELPARHVIVLIRRASRPSPTEILASFHAFADRLRAEHRSFGLVVDLRGVLGRSEPEFERGAAEVRRLCAELFPRVVTLVQTQAGLLQNQRLAREERRLATVSMDYDEALAIASGERR